MGYGKNFNAVSGHGWGWMMTSKFTLVGRGVVTMVVVLFIWAFLSQNLVVGIIGSAILLYLAYRRMEFHNLLKILEVGLDRKVLEEVIHKDSPITMKLSINSNEKISVKGSERIPDQFRFRSGNNKVDGLISPDEPLEMKFSLQPLERGMFRMLPMILNVVEGRGLFESEIVLDPRSDLFVRASKKEIALAHLMSRRKQFEITGPAHLRHSRTFQTDFRSIRDYIPGDRFRDIDWKAASRLTKLMTKEFEKETNIPTIIMVDTSLPMRELIKHRSKLDHAIAIALQVAVVMDNQHHPVGLVTFNETSVVEHISPGTVNVDEIVMSLFKLPNPLETGEYPGPPEETGSVNKGSAKDFIQAVSPFLHKRHRISSTEDSVTGIFKALREMSSYEETGLLIVILTDLETNTSSMMKALKIALGMKHRIVLVSPFSWLYHLERKDIDPDVLERVYLDNQRKQSVVKAMRASGVRVIEIDSHERGDKVLSGLRRLSR